MRKSTNELKAIINTLNECFDSYINDVSNETKISKFMDSIIALGEAVMLEPLSNARVVGEIAIYSPVAIENVQQILDLDITSEKEAINN